MVCKNSTWRWFNWRINRTGDDWGNFLLISVYLFFFQNYIKAMLNGEPVEIKTIEVAASENDKKYNGGKETKTIISKYQ